MGAGAAALAMPGPLSAVGKFSRKPNLIIILADDMGYGDSSVYDGWIKTPHLEKMAAAGLKFTDFHSSGVVCSPTRAGLMTGRYQQRAGIPGVINADPKLAVHYTGLQPTEVTFPKLLKKVGYMSGIFGKWHLGYAKNFNPLHHGFDRFRGYVSGNIDYLSHYDRMGVYDWWEGLEQVREEGYSTHLITKHAVKFIEDNRHRPFCLYVSHEAVHTPNQAPGDPPQQGAKKGQTKAKARSVKETYELMMKAMDDGIGEIMATVERLGLAENTLVFFFSDNGGTGRGSNAPLRGGKGSVWEGGHRVPGIAWWPGKVKPGKVSNDLCISLDLMPTMLELAGAAVPDGHKLDGISLAEHLLDGKSLGMRQLFWNGVAMRDGQWKLMKRDRGFEGPGLFNLAEDIGEKDNVADKYPERVKRMTAAIEAWKKDVASGAANQPALRPVDKSVGL
jgi:arylsulfatase A